MYVCRQGSLLGQDFDTPEDYYTAGGQGPLNESQGHYYDSAGRLVLECCELAVIDQHLHQASVFPEGDAIQKRSDVSPGKQKGAPAQEPGSNNAAE